jgi:hypothetical protein
MDNEKLIVKIYNGFFIESQSMKMLAVKLNIDRSSVCWLCRELRKDFRIGVSNKMNCLITNRVVNYYTTNPDLFATSNQLDLFDNK